ncbi:MAG: hypothetical protein A2V77_01845 [Anaeromyxobacter sp. RBG_16_69_14]|nr:MAG: hypothetical protein A2V77_01845 [Anaeromyxobacter sp. RBG_16_69_14]
MGVVRNGNEVLLGADGRGVEQDGLEAQVQDEFVSAARARHHQRRAAAAALAPLLVACASLAREDGSCALDPWRRDTLRAGPVGTSRGSARLQRRSSCSAEET